MDNVNSLTFEEMKTWDLVDYLAQLGHQPHHKMGNDFWYCSPLREEKNPSFKIARKHNVWYDHGVGKGGTIVDFVMAYFNCALHEVLEKANEQPSYRSIFQPANTSAKEPENRIQIVSVNTLHSLVLERYLHRRNIPPDIGKKWCKEIHFSIAQKNYNALGFLNRSGGWELRNDWFKGSSSPKDISLVQKGKPEITVFEGFFDFLSYLKIAGTSITNNQDFLILNSTAFINRSLPILEPYPTTKLFLDRDDTGLKCTRKLQEALKSCSDESVLYKGYKDLNEWHTSIGRQAYSKVKRLFK